jgi:hypothetical protein
VNQAEQILKQNLAAWQSLPPAQKTLARQQQALQNWAVRHSGHGLYCGSSTGRMSLANKRAMLELVYQLPRTQPRNASRRLGLFYQTLGMRLFVRPMYET